LLVSPQNHPNIFTAHKANPFKSFITLSLGVLLLFATLTEAGSSSLSLWERARVRAFKHCNFQKISCQAGDGRRERIFTYAEMQRDGGSEKKYEMGWE